MGVVVWLKGNALEKFALRDSQGAASARVGQEVHGTMRPQRKQQIGAELWGAYLVVIAAAASVTLAHPKPELIPPLLWHAGHSL
jgi:hypothetical protein